MIETRLEAKNAAAEENAACEVRQPVVNLEHEIECPRCHGMMALCSDFDSLYYFCEECDFCLYTIKRN